MQPMLARCVEDLAGLLRDALRTRIEEAGGDPDVLGKRPTQVGLGLARAKPLTVTKLFVSGCRERSIKAEQLFGHHEWRW
jgi:hypothetical protein